MNPTFAALGVTPATGAPVTAAPAPAATSSTGIPAGFASLGVVRTGSTAAPSAAPSSGPAPAPAPASVPASDQASGGPIPSLFPATGQESPVTAALKTVGNLPGSAANFAVGALKFPFQLAQSAAAVPGAVGKDIADNGVLGGISKAGNDLAAGVYGMLPPFIQNLNEAAAGGLAKFIQAKAPGAAAAEGAAEAGKPQPSIPGAQGQSPDTMITEGLQNASKTMQENPVGNIAPLLMAGREAAFADSPETGAAFDKGVSSVASPVLKTGSAAADIAKLPLKGVGKLATGIATYGTKALTGLDAPTIRAVVQNPEAFTPEAIATASRVDLAQNIKETIDAREEQLSESGKGYAPIRQSATPITLANAGTGTIDASTFDDMIKNNTGLELDKDGAWQPTAMSKVDAPTDVAKVNRFYQMWQPKFDAGQMTPDEFLTMRGKLAKIANYEGIGKSSELEGAAKGIRSDLNTNYRDQVPGLSEKDADFSSQKTELDALSKGLLDRDGNLRDSDINKIANATGKARGVLLQQLEELSPGVTKKINALKAIEDIRDTSERHKVGTYTRAFGGTTLGVGGLLTGNIPAVVAGITEAIISNPNVAVRMLRAYGWSKNIVAGVSANLGSIASAANELPNGSEASFGKLSPGLQSAAKTGISTASTLIPRRNTTAAQQ